MQTQQDLIVIVQQDVLVEIINAKAVRRLMTIQEMYDRFTPGQYERVKKAIDSLLRTKILGRRNDTLFLNRKKQKAIDAILSA